MAMLSRNGSGPDLALATACNLKVEGGSSRASAGGLAGTEVKATFWGLVAREAAERVVGEIPVGERAVLETDYRPVVLLVGHADGATRGWPVMGRFFKRVGEAIEQGRHGRVLAAAVDDDGECWSMIVLPLVDDDHAPLLQVVEMYVVQGLANHKGRI
jgi:hypothetical protein